MPSKGHPHARLSVSSISCCLLWFLKAFFPRCLGLILPKPFSRFLFSLYSPSRIALHITGVSFLLHLSPPSTSLWTCPAWAWLHCSDMYPSPVLPLITSTLPFPPLTLLLIVHFIFLSLDHMWHWRESRPQLLHHVWMDKQIVIFKLRCS